MPHHLGYIDAQQLFWVVTVRAHVFLIWGRNYFNIGDKSKCHKNWFIRNTDKFEMVTNQNSGNFKGQNNDLSNQNCNNNY